MENPPWISLWYYLSLNNWGVAAVDSASKAPKSSASPLKYLTGIGAIGGGNMCEFLRFSAIFICFPSVWTGKNSINQGSMQCVMFHWATFVSSRAMMHDLSHNQTFRLEALWGDMTTSAVTIHFKGGGATTAVFWFIFSSCWIYDIS